MPQSQPAPWLYWVRRTSVAFIVGSPYGEPHSGGARESNPPGTGTPPHSGFEIHGRHQPGEHLHKNGLPCCSCSTPVENHLPRLARQHNVEALLKVFDGELVG